MNRSDLMDHSEALASTKCTGLNSYVDSAPDNMADNKSALTKVHRSGFKQQFPLLDADRYLAQLRSVANGLLADTGSRIANLRPHLSAATPVRGVNPVSLCSTLLRSESTSARDRRRRLGAKGPVQRASQQEGRP